MIALFLALWFAVQPAAPPLATSWHQHTLTITVSGQGCLRLIGGGRRDAELPDSCGKGVYTISPAYRDQDYDPSGRTVVLRDYQGVDRAMLTLPADPGYHYLPLVVGP